jgi:anti-sigma B factor antagonist
VLDLGVLTIRTQQDNDADVLALDGELDVASCGEVEAQLRCMEGQCSDPAAIVIDLRGVTFIDSSGLRLLIEATNRAQTASHCLRLLRPNRRVFRVCEIAGIDTLLPFESAGAEDDG